MFYYEKKEVGNMFKKKLYLYLSAGEKKIVVQSLIELKNDLIRQGRYTDPVDELLIKVLSI